MSSNNVPKPVLDLPHSYLTAVENSVGTNLFRNLYYRIDDRIVDVLNDGDLSCAVYVSSILFLFGLISETHTTVKKTMEDIVAAGWKPIPTPRKGAVIHWGFMTRDDGSQSKHHHVGFYIDSDTAVSNDWQTKTIVRHHPTYGTLENGEPRRVVLDYYWHESLS